jgi:hypothetical protein
LSNSVGIMWSLNFCVYKVNTLQVLRDDSPEPSLAVIYFSHNNEILVYLLPYFKIKLIFTFQPLLVHIPDVGNQPTRKKIIMLSFLLSGSFSMPKQKSWWEKKLPCSIYNLSTWKHYSCNHKIWEVSLISTTVFWRFSNRRECVP